MEKLYSTAQITGPNDAWNMDSVAVLSHSARRIPRVIAEEAYKEYAAQGHGSQSFDRLHERGGFSTAELAILLFDRIKRIESIQR